MTSPFVSIVMPVCNENRFIEKALISVIQQTYPSGRMEILAVDGMSEDGTREIIHRFQEKYSCIKLIDNPQKIVSAGLNLALREARGEIIIRVDGHCEIAKDYVSQCVELLEKQEADMVGGPIETVGETPVAQAIALAMSSFFGIGGSAFRMAQNQKKYVDTVAFFAAKRETLDKVGPFDEELVRNQDDEYNYRLRKMGFRILLEPSIKSRYYSRASIISLWKQYFQYGFWKVRVLQKHPRQMQWRQFVPPLFAASLPISFFGNFIILELYFLAVLFASLQISLKKGWKYFLFLFLVFPGLHLGYGLGFLRGLVCFANRWHDQTIF